MEKNFNIGVVGFSGQKFDETVAKAIISKAFDYLWSLRPRQKPPISARVVSGLTNVGIPALAYAEAKSRGWDTIGIACKKAEEYECFPCTEKIIVGKEWGDESETFLRSIDVLLRVGGGKQSLAEVAKAKEMGLIVREFDLDAKK